MCSVTSATADAVDKTEEMKGISNTDQFLREIQKCSFQREGGAERSK